MCKANTHCPYKDCLESDGGCSVACMERILADPVICIDKRKKKTSQNTTGLLRTQLPWCPLRAATEVVPRLIFCRRSKEK